MTFTSFEFLLFFLAVTLLRGCFRGFSAEKWFLLAASYCFYLSWSVPCSLLILFTSLMDFHLGRSIGLTSNPVRRKWLLLTSLLGNLGLLGFFKYTNFLLENVCFILNALGAHVQNVHYNIILPPAISYFTFASMGYVIDVYYERLAPCQSARDYSCFIAFFPKLLSGPIVRAADFLPQLEQRLRASAVDIETGLTYFMIGAVKKLVISDQIAGHVNLIFSSPAQYDGLTLLQGLLGYAVQIYCDFSGYTDIAIGCARILGFRLPANFQMPYSSSTITEFWRRWHITLSGWFRDYVFLPLEVATRSNPNPTLRASANLLLTMLLCGLWHGASWNFVVWGGIHGAALAIHRIWKSWNPLAALNEGRAFNAVWALIARFLTLSVILVGWIFFRSQSWTEAIEYLLGIVTWSHAGTRLLSPYIIPAIAAVVAAHVLVSKDRNWAEEIPARSLSFRILTYSGLALILVCLAATDSAPFIYFQF